jgi:hypothetical protein
MELIGELGSSPPPTGQWGGASIHQSRQRGHLRGQWRVCGASPERVCIFPLRVFPGRGHGADDVVRLDLAIALRWLVGRRSPFRRRVSHSSRAKIRHVPRCRRATPASSGRPELEVDLTRQARWPSEAPRKPWQAKRPIGRWSTSHHQPPEGLLRLSLWRPARQWQSGTIQGSGQGQAVGLLEDQGGSARVGPTPPAGRAMSSW